MAWNPFYGYPPGFYYSTFESFYRPLSFPPHRMAFSRSVNDPVEWNVSILHPATFANSSLEASKNAPERTVQNWLVSPPKIGKDVSNPIFSSNFPQAAEKTADKSGSKKQEVSDEGVQTPTPTPTRSGKYETCFSPNLVEKQTG